MENPKFTSETNGGCIYEILLMENENLGLLKYVTKV